LTLLQRAGEIKAFDIQYKIPIEIDGRHITNHYVDFIVFKKGNITEFHEVKGYATELWKLKRKLVEALYPNIAYIVKTEKPKWTHGAKRP